MPTPRSFAEEMLQLAFDYSVSDYDTFRAKGEQSMRKTLMALGQTDKDTTRAVCAALMALDYESGVIIFQRAPNVNMENVAFQNSKTKG